MRILPILAVTSLVFFLCPAAYSSADEPDSLVLHLRLDKQTYLFGEDIRATFVLQNTTSRTLAVYPDASSMTTWQIVNEAGKVVCPYMDHWEMGPVELTPLASGDSLSVRAPACPSYGRSEKMLADTACISPGKHVLRGVYNRAYYSEPCSLLIVVPTGDELLAYQLLCKAYPRKFFPDKKEEAILALEQLCSQYAKSVYREQGFERLAFFYRNRKDLAKVREVVSQFAELYPNSKYAGRILNHLQYEQPPSAYEGFLQALIAQKPGTEVARQAQVILKSNQRDKGDD
jgi:hypothetical protein